MATNADCPELVSMRVFFPHLLVLPSKREPDGAGAGAGACGKSKSVIDIQKCLLFPRVKIPLSLQKWPSVIQLDEYTCIKYDKDGKLAALGTRHGDDDWFCQFNLGSGHSLDKADCVSVYRLKGLLSVSNGYIAIHTHSRTFLIEIERRTVLDVSLYLTGNFVV